MTTDDIGEKLKQITLFKALMERPDELQLVRDNLERKTLEKGAVIIEEGQDGDELFILLHGEIEILKHTTEGEPYTVAKLNDGMNVFFGELALVDRDKRSATVRALTRCDLLVLNRTRFTALGEKNPRLGWHLLSEIAGLLSKRLRKANEDALVLFETLVNELAG